MYKKPHYLENLLWLLDTDELKALGEARGLSMSGEKPALIETIMGEERDIQRGREYLELLEDKTLHRLCEKTGRTDAWHKLGNELVNYCSRSFAKLQWSYHAPVPEEDESVLLEEEHVSIPLDALLLHSCDEVRNNPRLLSQVAELTSQAEQEVLYALQHEPSGAKIQDTQLWYTYRVYEESEAEEIEEDSFDFADELTIDSESPEEETTAEVIGFVSVEFPSGVGDNESWTLEPFMEDLYDWFLERETITTYRRRSRGSILIRFTHRNQEHIALFGYFNDTAPITDKSLRQRLDNYDTFYGNPVSFRMYFAREFADSATSLLEKKSRWRSNVALVEIPNFDEHSRKYRYVYKQRKRLRPWTLIQNIFFPNNGFEEELDDITIDYESSNTPAPTIPIPDLDSFLNPSQEQTSPIFVEEQTTPSPVIASLIEQPFSSSPDQPPSGSDIGEPQTPQKSVFAFDAQKVALEHRPETILDPNTQPVDKSQSIKGAFSPPMSGLSGAEDPRGSEISPKAGIFSKKSLFRLLFASGIIASLIGGVWKFMIYPKLFPCEDGLRECGKLCAHLASSDDHCGRCGQSCSKLLKGARCKKGVCTCPKPLVKCGNQCVNLANSQVACGRCGKSCPQGGSCVKGQCQCPSGMVVCQGQCVKLSSNAQHCGSCGNACKKGCKGGFCREHLFLTVKGIKKAKAVRVMPSKFWMGTSSDPKDKKTRWERPQTQVTINYQYWMWQTEVTQQQFQEIMGYNPSQFKSCGAYCPVERVTWYEAMHFCNQLSRRAELDTCYRCRVRRGRVLSCQLKRKYRKRGRRGSSRYHRCSGWRLPTEAEWEFAARSIEGKKQNLDVGGFSWYSENSHEATHRVARKKGYPLELFDLFGNVEEWVIDRRHRYPGGYQTNPVYSTRRRTWITTRGGSWKSKAEDLRASFRKFRWPTYRKEGIIGFRPVRTVQTK